MYKLFGNIKWPVTAAHPQAMLCFNIHSTGRTQRAQPSLGSSLQPARRGTHKKCSKKKNPKFLIYRFPRKPIQCSLLLSNFLFQYKQEWKAGQVFLGTEIWTLLNFTVYPWHLAAPHVSVASASDQRYHHWAVQRGWKISPHGNATPNAVSCVSLWHPLTTLDHPSPLGQPRTGPSSAALLSLLSDGNSLSQDGDVEFEPHVGDAQSTVHRCQHERDKRKALFPGSQREYNFTEDFQRHQLDEVDCFQPVQERPISPDKRI